MDANSVGEGHRAFSGFNAIPPELDTEIAQYLLPADIVNNLDLPRIYGTIYFFGLYKTLITLISSN